jgi:hypothetical protein
MIDSPRRFEVINRCGLKGMTHCGGVWLLAEPDLVLNIWHLLKKIEGMVAIFEFVIEDQFCNCHPLVFREVGILGDPVIPLYVIIIFASNFVLFHMYLVV